MAIDWALYAKAAVQFVGDEKTRKGLFAIVGIILAVVIAIVLFFFVIVIIVVSMFGQIDGYYYPIPDVTVSSGYGAREPIRVFIPGTGWTTTSSFHSGTDFVAPMGTTIFASAAGEVIVADYAGSSMLGLYITIEHDDGSLTKYAHCSELFVNVGDLVAGFQPIAKVGSTGASTGAHLHFELWVEGGTISIDASTILQPWPEEALDTLGQSAAILFVQIDLLRSSQESLILIPRRTSLWTA